jgi:hypothetical protein
MGMGAESLSPDRVRLPRAPAARLNAAKGDVFCVRRDANGDLWVEENLERSGYCAIGVALEPNSPLDTHDGRVDAILDRFAPLGVTGIGMFGNTVLDVPPDADLSAVRRLLDQAQHNGWWNYKELCVTDAWRATISP